MESRMGNGGEGATVRLLSKKQMASELGVRLREDIAELEERKQDVNEKIRDMYDHRDEAKVKFLAMDEYNRQKDSEITEKETRLEQLKQDYAPYSAQEDLNLLIDVFPKMGENRRMVRFCKDIGLTTDDTRTLFRDRVITVSGKLHSPEHDCDFEVRDAKLQLTNDSDDPNAPRNPYRLCLSLNGQNILDWFREQFEKLRQVVRPYVRQAIAQPRQKKGQGI